MNVRRMLSNRTFRTGWRYNKLSTDRVVRWRLLLEEFGPEFKHINGKDNVNADALSRLNTDEIEFGEPKSTDEKGVS